MKNLIIKTLLVLVIVLQLPSKTVYALPVTTVTPEAENDKVLNDEEIEKYKEQITARYNKQLDDLYKEYDALKAQVTDVYDRLQKAQETAEKQELLDMMEDLKDKLSEITELITKQTDLYNTIITDLTSDIEIKEALIEEKMRELFESENFSISEDGEIERIEVSPTIQIVEYEEVEVSNSREIATAIGLVLLFIALIVIAIISIKVKIMRKNKELETIERNREIRQNSEAEKLKEITSMSDEVITVDDDIDSLF